MTAKDTPDRLSEKPPLSMGVAADSVLASVMIDPDKRFQTIEGFGGAFTEAAAVTLRSLSPANQERILRAYFEPVEGHGYSLCRTHINSCDFSLGNYAYTDVAGDTELRHFSIDRDRAALLPMIREAQNRESARLNLAAGERVSVQGGGGFDRPGGST